MATVIVKTTQSTKKTTLSDFPAGSFSPEEFNKALQEQGVNTSGMSISFQDLEDVEEIYEVRTSDGHWEDGVDISEEGVYIVNLNPKSTSNG